MIDKAYILYIDDPMSVKWAQECAFSCEEHGVPWEMFKGFKGLSCDELTYRTGWVCGRPGMEKEDRQYVREYNAALGHIRIWEKIVAGGKPCAILEHDAIVKKNFTQLEMHGDVMYLGPRVFSRDDYEFPHQLETSYNPTRRFEGLHAYVLSPETAQFLLDRVRDMRRILPSEAMLSVRNPFNMDLRAVDPPFVVCELGNRKSFTMQDEITIPQNFKNEPGFLAGFKDESRLFKTTDYSFSEDWFSANVPVWEELFKIAGLSKDAPLQALEIGSFEGRATCWMIDNMMDHPESRIFAVDTFMGSIEHTDGQKESLLERFQRNVIVSKWPEKLTPIRGDSRAVLPGLFLQDKKFDFIYVDGSHETLDVIMDGIMAYRLAKPGALIVFDDYSWNLKDSVKVAVDILEKIIPMKLVYSGYQRAYLAP